MNLQLSTIWLGLCRMRKELSAQTDRQSLTLFGAKQSILWLGLLMAFFGWPGSQPRVCGQVYRFTSYSVNTGLPHNSVYCLFQDSQGYMWFGTESGVCRFDGLEYKTFTVRDGLADPVVRDLFEDRQNRLWIVTESGVSRFDGLRFTSFKAAQGFSPEEAYSGMCSRDGTLWFGTADGLIHYDGQIFTRFGKDQGVPTGRIWSLVEDQAGKIWLGIRGEGLLRYDGKTFTRFGVNEGLPNEVIFGLAEDPRGGLWITTDQGLVFYDGFRFRTYSLPEGLPISKTNQVVIDRYYRIWVTTFGGGLCRLEDGKFVVFNRTNGVPDNYLTSITLDYEGNIWCATRSSGVFRFSSEQFASYTQASGLSEGRVSALGETPDETLWVASVDGGLRTMSKSGDVNRLGTSEGLPDKDIWTLYVDRLNRIWASSYQGLFCRENGRWRKFTREEIGARERITSIIEDHQGNIWLGSYPSTSNGVLRYDGKSFTLFSIDHGLSSNSISGFMVDHTGSLWACNERGVSRFNGQRFSSLTPADGLPSRRVSCALEDERGVIWIGTDSGLCQFVNEKIVKIYTTDDGLVGNVIRTLNSCQGMLWVGTTRGISQFNGTTFRNFTTQDGLVSDDVSFGACLTRRDGGTWFGTNDGVSRYKAAKEISLPVPPRLALSTVRIQEKTVEIIPKDNQVSLQLPPLSYYENTLTFEFAAMSFIDPEAVRYQYRLEGFDQNWSAPVSDRFVRFINLPPGNYWFFIRAISASGVWTEPQNIQVTIQLPFWQTWWFRLLVLLLVATIIGVVYTANIYRIKRRQEEKLAVLRQIQEQRIKSLRELLESIRVINSNLELENVLQNIAEESARLVDGEPGGIGLVENGKVCFRRLWRQDHWESSPLEFHLGDGIAGKVAQSARPMIVNDPVQSTDVIYPELIEEYFVHGWMDVPIVARSGQVVGVLDVRRKSGRPPFTESDCHLIEALAHQAAVAIENAGLYGELEEKNLMVVESMHELEKLYKQEREVTRALQDIDRMKTNFITVMSHEMRTPLTVIKGYNEAILDQYFGPLTPIQEKSLQTCQRMVERLVCSFNDILEMLKINEGHVELRYERVNIRTLVDDVLSDLANFIENRHQHITLDAPAEFHIEIDSDKIRMVLLNLIQNAIKFTQDDGEITISIKYENGQAKLCVADTGIGLDQGEVEKIFDRFYTSPDASTHTSGRFEFLARGTGLGLAIARSYVEAHFGKIWAESDGPGLGSRFYVVLPLSQAGKEDSGTWQVSQLLSSRLRDRS